MALPGLTGPGGGLMKWELLEAWRGVYLTLMALMSRDEVEARELEDMKGLLVQVHERVEAILEEVE